MSNEKLGFKTQVKITLRNENGEVLSEQVRENLIVNNGRIQAALMLGCGGISGFKYIELGTRNAIAAGDTKLLGYVANTRARATVKRTNYCAIWTHTWTKGEFGAGTLREAGLFQSPTQNTGTYMLSHVTFTLVNKIINQDTLTIEWQISPQ